VARDGTVTPIAAGRRHRRYWVGDGKAHIEVRASRRLGSERFARQLEGSLRHLHGVNWAHVNAVVGRVVVAFDGDAIDVSDLLETIEGVEETHDVDDDRFEFDRPDFPCDVEPLQRAVVSLVPTRWGSAPGSLGLCSEPPPCHRNWLRLFLSPTLNPAYAGWSNGHWARARLTSASPWATPSCKGGARAR